MNLTEELDRSFDDGPAHRPIEDRLEAGHRRVRRRRIAASAAALASVAVLGTVGFALADAGSTSADGSVATQQPDEDDENALMPGEDVRLERDGTLLKRAGVGVVREVRNPWGDPSVGLVYTLEGQTYWALLDPAGGTFEVARQSFPTFDYWLADQVAMQNGQPTLALVEFGRGETLLPRHGVEMIRQTGDLSMMPASFAGPGDRTAVAEVTYDGERWYVLARQIGTDAPEYFPTAASVSRPTLEEFLPYAADSYENGTGLR